MPGQWKHAWLHPFSFLRVNNKLVEMVALNYRFSSLIFLEDGKFQKCVWAGPYSFWQFEEDAFCGSSSLQPVVARTPQLWLFSATAFTNFPFPCLLLEPLFEQMSLLELRAPLCLHNLMEVLHYTFWRNNLTQNPKTWRSGLALQSLRNQGHQEDHYTIHIQ